MSSTFELTVSRIIPASRKEVFDAWLSPDALQHFMCPAQGVTVPKVEVDAREGGSFLIVMTVGEKEMPHRGEYKTIQRYEQLAFTWVSEHSIPGSLVTIDFKETSPNETEVVLHHVGFPSEESRTNHKGGWGRILETLGNHLG